MIMIAGNNTVLQVAKDSYTGDVPTAATSGFKQIRFSSFSMDYIPNKKQENVLTGSIGQSRFDTMSVKAEGNIATLARPDDLGFFLYMLLGNQELVDDDVFKFTPHKNTLSSFTIKIDKGAGLYTYPGSILNSLSFKCEPEDYLNLDLEIKSYDEFFTTGSLTPIQPSTQRAFKFHQGKVYIGNSLGSLTELADINSIGLTYNNSVENTIQTTSTNLHYKKPVPNTRICTVDLGCLYSQESEAFRQSYFKTDTIFSIKLDFQTDEGNTGDLHKLTIEIPNVQTTSCSVPVSDGNSIKQTMSMTAIDLGSGDLITCYLDNSLSTLY
jgi:hypothetical protein